MHVWQKRDVLWYDSWYLILHGREKYFYFRVNYPFMKKNSSLNCYPHVTGSSFIKVLQSKLQFVTLFAFSHMASICILNTWTSAWRCSFTRCLFTYIYYVRYSKQTNLVLQIRLCRTKTEPCCQNVPECSVLITNTNMFCQTSKTPMLFSPLILELPVLQQTTKPQVIYWVGISVDFGENGQRK